MTAVKRYGQFCALARALDEVGDRWTLLVVRELMVEPAGYSDLQTRLPGVATNLLADRLARLQEHGLVARDAASRRYALTPRGLALRPVLHELIRWGAPLMASGPGDDAVDDRWAALALDAVLTTPHVTGAASRVRLRCGSLVLDVVTEASGRRVVLSEDTAANAVVSGAMPDVLHAAHAGKVTRALRVSGDRAAARRALRPADASEAEQR